MTGRFVVTKELLELTIAAKQQFELSENLDEDGGKEFMSSVKQALTQIKQQHTDKSSSRSSGSGDEGDDDIAVEMEQGWMTFQVTKNGSKNQPWI